MYVPFRKSRGDKLHSLKACYFKKVGLVDLSSYGGKIKFEFLVLKIQLKKVINICDLDGWFDIYVNFQRGKICL